METTHNTNPLGPGTSNKRTVQWWFKKFCKGDKSFGDEEQSDWPSEVDNNKLSAIIKADPLTTTWKFAQELNVGHSVVIWHLRKIGNVKKLDKWVPHELTANQKNHCFKVSSTLILHNNKLFLNQIVMCNKKWILCDNGRWPALGCTEKKLQSTSQSQICTKKKKKAMITVWWSAADLIHCYSFLNLSETITSEKQAQQIDERHQKL